MYSITCCHSLTCKRSCRKQVYIKCRSAMTNAYFTLSINDINECLVKYRYLLRLRQVPSVLNSSHFYNSLLFYRNASFTIRVISLVCSHSVFRAIKNWWLSQFETGPSHTMYTHTVCFIQGIVHVTTN